MRDILLRSKTPGRGAISPSIPFYALETMRRDIVIEYINNHKDTAIVRAASPEAKSKNSGALAAVSYYDNKTIVHNILSSFNAIPDPDVLVNIFYTDDLPGFGSHITKIIKHIPSAGGKRRKRNTYKKRHARRRKTQYRRRR